MKELLKLEDLKQQIEELSITTDDEEVNANELAKFITSSIKTIKASHKDGIAEAHRIHKELKAKEKEELKPYEEAKKIIADAIYQYEKDKQKKLQLEKEINKELGLEIEVPKNESKVLKGTYVKETWKARVVDADKVPVKHGSWVIREISQSVLNELAKLSNGEADIPGVEFYKDGKAVIR